MSTVRWAAGFALTLPHTLVDWRAAHLESRTLPCATEPAAAGRHAEPHHGVGKAVFVGQWRAAKCRAERSGGGHLILPVIPDLVFAGGSSVL